MKTVINDLLNYNNLKIVQCNEYFNFSLDSVILPNFVIFKKNCKTILDFGCGNLPISMILSTKTNARICGIEVQSEIYKLAKESLKINKLEDRIEIINDDIKNVTNYFTTDSVDIVVSNPPYFKKDEDSNINDNLVKAIARHEILITLEDIICKARIVLKNGGSLYIVHRSDRFTDIVYLMRNNNIEPKRVRFVYPKEKSDSNLVLIEGVKNGRSGLKVLTPLVVHNSDGSYTREIIEMFQNN